MSAPSFAEARHECRQRKVELAEMVEVIDRVERRETGARERAMGPLPNVDLYREPVVLEAAMRLLMLIETYKDEVRSLLAQLKRRDERKAA